MRFDKVSDFKLLDKCLKIKELLYVPQLYQTSSELREFFTTEELDTIPYEELYQLSQKYGVQDTMQDYIYSRVNRDEYRSISKMPDDEKVKYLNDIRSNPDNAVTGAISSFARLMLNAPAEVIAARYSKRINDFKEDFVSKSSPMASTVSKLDSLQHQLLRDYPLTIHAPSRTPNNNQITSTNQIEPVLLKLAKVAGKIIHNPKVQKGTATVLVAAILATGGTSMVNNIVAASRANNTSFAQMENMDGSSSVLSPELNEDLLSIRDNFTKFTNEIPTDEEYREFLNTVDDFYNESFAYVSLKSYNRYANENGLPLGSSVKVMYDDRDSTESHDILQITDAEGTTHNIDVRDGNIFKSNSPSSVYSSERHIDNLRSEYLNAVRSGSSEYDLAQLKQDQLKKLEDDFTDVLDTLVLDYSYSKAGLLSRFFNSNDLKLKTSAPEQDDIDR